MPAASSLILFLLILALPVVMAVVVLLVPSRRVEASGIVCGNPLHEAPLARQETEMVPPLVQLCRMLDGRELEGYVLGMRHLPVEAVAPLLQRLVQGVDPALQLYAQSVRQQGLDNLQAQYQLLLKAAPDDSRKAAWLLETGLKLAHPSLSSIAEREMWLTRLADLADSRLSTARHDPALLATAAEVYLAASRPQSAAALVPLLEMGSTLRAKLYARSTHAIHQSRNCT